MGSIVTLKAKALHQPTITMLTELLSSAQNGDIQSVACATLDGGGYTSSCFAMAPGQSDFAMVGSIEYMKSRLVKRIAERD